MKAGHRPQLQMLVTDAWLLVAAIMLRYKYFQWVNPVEFVKNN